MELAVKKSEIRNCRRSKGLKRVRENAVELNASFNHQPMPLDTWNVFAIKYGLTAYFISS
uniref:Uncharacterized protein n=1 Tax=Arundo donax TaxID=35708 RepID=A0A0A9FRW7_ARUDO